MSPEEFLKEFGHLAGTERGSDQIRALALTVCLPLQDGPSASIAEVAAVVRGVSYPKSAVSEVAIDGYLPLLRANSIQKELVLDDLLHIPQAHVKPEQLLQEGDLLMAMSSGSKDLVGKATLVRRPMLATFGAFCAVVRPSKIIEPAFLLHFVRSHRFKAQAFDSAKGIGINNLTASDLRAIKISLPPLPEQKRIVEKVDQLMALCNELEAKQKQKREKAVAFNQAALSAVVHASDKSKLKSSWSRVQNHFEVLYELPENVKELRQTILQLAVMGKLVRQEEEENASYLVDDCRRRKDELTLQGHQRRSRELPVESDNGPDWELPKSWAWCRVDDLAHVSTGSTPSRGNQRFWNGGIPWVSSGEVANCRIRETKETITQEGLENSSCRILPPGTLLIAMIGQGKTRGQSAVLDIAAASNQNSAALQFASPAISSEYVWYWAQSQYAISRAGGRGNAQPALNAGKVRALWVPLPPAGEQPRIALAVARLFSLCDDIEVKLAQHRDQGQRLMQAVVESLVDGLGPPFL